MVTAPAPALSDSHALPQAAVGAASNSSQSPNSFQSVYQSLPAHPGSSEDRSNSQLPSSKAAAGKKTSTKDNDDTLAAIVSPAIVDPSPARPLAPSLPSFSLTARDHEAANELAQLSSDVRSGIQGAEQALANPANPVSTSITASANQSLAHREAAFNSQAAAVAPSFSIGAPALPIIPGVKLTEPSQPAAPSRSARTAAATSSDPAIDPALFTKGLAATLAPRQSNLAFSLKMAESNSTAKHAQQAMQSEPADRTATPASQAKGQERSPAVALAASVAHATDASASATGEVAVASTTLNNAWNVAAPTSQLDIRPDAEFSEASEPANLSTVAAMHEAQQILPETPRPTAAADIMLQLGGKDQSAAIRVSDRAGTVNVTVHAADADLRTSLRSNLGDLTSQLSHQGWKTEVVKTGTVLTRGETSQDPQQGGQRPPNQQQPSSQGDRQQQRERRSNSGQWLAEFEEQASGNSRGTT